MGERSAAARDDQADQADLMNGADPGPLRRVALLAFVLVATAAATQLMARALAADGLSVPEIGILPLFALTFGWICYAFSTALVGFLLQLGNHAGAAPGELLKPATIGPTTARTALLMPIYHEDPVRVAARLAAVYRSLASTGRLDAFDLFILSDSRDSAVVHAEQVMWARLCAELGAAGRLFYRVRTENHGRKAGNIAEFCRNWGAGYRYFVVLDADSVMTGATLTQLVDLMEANPSAGLIQTVPQPVGGHTLFARIQQFAARLYGPLCATGMAYWYLDRNNYWGHNAIIRTHAFMTSAGLPALPGAPPLGGEIMSHDFVEAALLRRAGWSVWLVPELGGSYEELPPTIGDYAQRDRRWCLGNLQHLRLLATKGLCAVSRVHLATGALSYLASPIWFLLLLLTMLEAIRAAYLPDPAERSLFPAWPFAERVDLLGLFCIAMAMLLLPKLMALLLALGSPERRQALGGAGALIKSTVAEIVFSALLAPLLMLKQTVAVVDILLGARVSWGGQSRDGANQSWRVAIREYGAPTLLGGCWALIAFVLTPALLPWLAPVLVGLVLAIPMALLSGRADLGLAAARRGWFLVPEEIDPPRELAWMGNHTETLPGTPAPESLAPAAEGAVSVGLTSR
jgi:membrane glycosyltransferase